MSQNNFVQLGLKLAALLAILPFPALMAAYASTPSAPSLSVKAGKYSAAFTVKISDTSSCARRYYTTNGSTPTKSSAVYSNPISISKTTTLKAIAQCWGGSASAVTSATYTIAKPATTPPPSTSTTTSASSFFGMDVNGLTYGTPWPDVSVGTLRLWDSNTPWNMLNPSSGTYSWTYLDENIKLAQENNAQIIYTFGRTPKWATANGSCTGSYAPNGCEEAPVEADWDAFVTAIVDHVGPGVIKYWELWNEANLTGEYWNGSNAQLVQMAADARKIIKAVDPNAIILSPSETDNYTGSTACLTTNRCGSAWLTGWLAAGGKEYIDGVAFHGYPQMNTTPEQVVSQVANQRAVMSANGLGSRPLLDTESSWGENSNLPAAANQVAFLARHLILEQSSGVTTSVWYAYDGGDWGPLWNKTSGLNDAGEAYGQVARWLTGATLTKACSASGSTYTCAYSRSGGYTALAVWNTGGNVTFSVPAGYTQYRNLGGDLIAVNGATVPISTAPILLENKSAF